MQWSVSLVAALCTCVAGASLPECPASIFNGFCHPWELRDGGVACVADTSKSAKITKPSQVQCVPKKNGGVEYKCPSWVPHMCQPEFPGPNIVGFAEDTPDLSTLVTALKAGKLTDALAGEGPFTVFAPTNEAFAKLPKATLDHLLDPKNIKELDAILEYHVIAGVSVFKADLKADQKVKTLGGQELEIKKTTSGQVLVGNAKTIDTDLESSNGVVHTIDAVLTLPKKIVRAADASLPECPASIFNGFCHPWELRDGGVACVADTSKGAKITNSSQVQCVPKKNGGVEYTCPSWLQHMCQPEFPGPNIVAFAADTPDLSTLVTALKAGKLTGALAGEGPFTVFAPTNEAFAKLPKATLDHLLDPKNIKELDAILEYHVISGVAVFKADLKADQKVKTLEGKELEIKKTTSGQVLVGNAKTIDTDLESSNGVVHTIDAVLTLPATAASATDIIV